LWSTRKRFVVKPESSIMLPDFRVRQRDYLLEITRAITRELDLDSLLARILNISAEMLAGQAGLIALRGEQENWTVASVHGISQSILRYLNAHLSQIQRRDDPLHTELPEVTRLIQGLTEVTSSAFLSYVGLPLFAFNRLIGVIYIFRSYPGVFSPNDRALLQSFADQAAIAVHNAQLYTHVSQENQRMDALIDTVADGILIMSPNHIIERCNPAFTRLSGKATDEIIGKDHQEVIVWRSRRHGITLEQAESGGWPLTVETSLYVEGEIERPDGTPLPVGITYAPLLAPEGILLNTIATVRDISHFREAEELKSTFISVISHELKTPVALIKGYVATLRREDARWDRAVIDDSLQVIEEEADRLAEMIENLLDASRFEAGGFKLNMAEVDLGSLVNHLVERFRTQSDKHQFKVEISAEFPTIYGDEERLTQVISNLLSNAIKYSSNGGEIRITGSLQPDKVVVCVSDQGAGISKGDAPHIFDRFYRAYDASRTTKGAGLGLYLARAIIEAHQGRIWVDMNYNDGARICFSLPRN
jgi:PAS domain S-box-containing protein